MIFSQHIQCEKLFVMFVFVKKKKKLLSPRGFLLGYQSMNIL